MATSCFALIGASLVLVSVGGLGQTAPFSDTTLLLAYEATLIGTGDRLERPADSPCAEDRPTSLISSSSWARPTLGHAPCSTGACSWRPLARDRLSTSSGSYVGDDGEPMTLPSGSDERTVTFVKRDRKPVAALIHDAALGGRSGAGRRRLRPSRLTGANARLQVELREQVRELEASRRRARRGGRRTAQPTRAAARSRRRSSTWRRCERRSDEPGRCAGGRRSFARARRSASWTQTDRRASGARARDPPPYIGRVRACAGARRTRDSCADSRVRSRPRTERFASAGRGSGLLRLR